MATSNNQADAEVAALWDLICGRQFHWLKDEQARMFHALNVEKKSYVVVALEHAERLQYRLEELARECEGR